MQQDNDITHRQVWQKNRTNWLKLIKMLWYGLKKLFMHRNSPMWLKQFFKEERTNITWVHFFRFRGSLLFHTGPRRFELFSPLINKIIHRHLLLFHRPVAVNYRHEEILYFWYFPAMHYSSFLLLWWTKPAYAWSSEQAKSYTHRVNGRCTVFDPEQVASVYVNS